MLVFGLVLLVLGLVLKLVFDDMYIYIYIYRSTRYRNTGIPEYRNTGIPGYRNTGLPDYRNTGIPDYRLTGIPEYLNTLQEPKNLHNVGNFHPPLEPKHYKRKKKYIYVSYKDAD